MAEKSPSKHTKESQTNSTDIDTKMVWPTHYSITTLNVNGLNFPIKRLAERIKTKIYLCAVYKKYTRQYRLKMKEWKILHTHKNRNEKCAGVAILISATP